MNVHLDNRTNPVGTPDMVADPDCRYPSRPLVGLREGLRANDPITLASAFWILANEGGTVHLMSIPGSGHPCHFCLKPAHLGVCN
jgi:hypothetical protein